MQHLPDEVSGDDKDWNPHDDPEFERDQHLIGTSHEERLSNPIFANQTPMTRDGAMTHQVS